jgi:hypothetical protein
MNTSARFAVATCAYLLVSCASVSTGLDKEMRVSRGGVATIKLTTPHQGKLAVITPSGKWIVLVDGHTKNRLITSAELLATDTLQIDTSALSGVTFQNGKELVVPVFSEKGRYQFVVTENLDTEMDNMNSQIKVITYE